MALLVVGNVEEKHGVLFLQTVILPARFVK